MLHWIVEFVLNIVRTPLDLSSPVFDNDFVFCSLLSQKNHSSLKMWSQFARCQRVTL